MTRLRVGILAGSIGALAPWEVRLFDKICADSRFELVAVLVGSGETPLPAAQRSSLAGLAFKLDLDRLARAPAVSGPAFRQSLTTAKTIPVTGAHWDGGGVTAPTTIASLGQLSLDVLLVHGLDPLAAPLSQYTRFGAWWLQHAGQRLQTTSAAQALACLDCGPMVPVALMAVTDGNVSTVRALDAASFNLERTPATTLARTAEKSVSLVWRALQRLAASGTLTSAKSTDEISTVPPAPATVGRLSAARYARPFAARASGLITKRLARLAGQHDMRWSLFFGNGAFDPASLEQMREVRPAHGEFWADPFLLDKDGETFVFFENYVYATGLGKISVGTYRDGHMRVLGDALDLPYHLSFPLVFEHGGQIYMVPETCAAKRVEVWRAVEFPLRWERVATALEGQSAADPVVFEDQGRWWLFANISNTPFEDHCNELYVFEADGPMLTRLTPHPRNPVVIGSGTARNGGRIVRRGGKLLRMSQNNSHGIYGYGLNVMEITELDANHYSERCLASVEPTFKPGLIGCHHMDQSAGIFVLDACRRSG